MLVNGWYNLIAHPLMYHRILMIVWNHFAWDLLHLEDVVTLCSKFRSHYHRNGESNHSGPVCFSYQLLLWRSAIGGRIIRAYTKNSYFKRIFLTSMLNLYHPFVIYPQFHKRRRIPCGLKICYSWVCLKFTPYGHHLFIIGKDKEFLRGIKGVEI